MLWLTFGRGCRSWSEAFQATLVFLSLNALWALIFIATCKLVSIISGLETT